MTPKIDPIQEQAELDKMKAELDELRPQHEAISSRYYELSRAYTKACEAKAEREKRNRLWKLESKCSYEEPEYPSMGSPGRNGSARFTDQAEAEELVTLLRSRVRYYKAYVLKWNGPGNYDVIPDWRYDHDREVVYTATFEKTHDEPNADHT